MAVGAAEALFILGPVLLCAILPRKLATILASGARMASRACLPGNQQERYVHSKGTGTYKHKCKHPKYTSTSEGRRQRSSLCKRARRRGGATLYLSPNGNRGWGGIRQSYSLFFLEGAEV